MRHFARKVRVFRQGTAAPWEPCCITPSPAGSSASESLPALGSGPGAAAQPEPPQTAPKPPVPRDAQGQGPRRDHRHSHGPHLARMTVIRRKTLEPRFRECDWSQCDQRSDSHGPAKPLLISIRKNEEGTSMLLLSGLWLPPPLKHISHPI